MPIRLVQSPPRSRRHFLREAGAGLSGIALAWLLSRERGAAATPVQHPLTAGATRPPHFPPRAKRVIQLYACGGVSHLDTYDYKPDLIEHDGEELTNKGNIDTFFGKPGRLMKSPFSFRRHGQSGLWMSDLLPNLATCVDDLTFIYSMTSKSSNHTPATFFMNTGFTMNGFPCLGAWMSYGLGSENQDLPAFVVLPDARQLPAGGAINWTAGFLPAVNQGVAFRTSGQPITDLATPQEVPPRARLDSMELLAKMNHEFLEAHPDDSTLAARIRSYELAARMQASVPETVNFDSESAQTRKLYGLDSEVTAGFGRNCLLARRLLERGVRFVQVFNGGAFGSPRINWDGHENIVENHTKQAAVMDQPVAGLLKDLKARGMLDDTLVLWTTEFGRTPITQGIGALGRDHHPNVFTVWMAGAGLKPGFGYGASDEVGYFPAEKPVQVYDLHATVLHLLGLDHERLTYYHNGIQRRLTDVHGRVVKELLA
ncbi:MAG TPA: DUF1501 domain-containing protein [Verrucomicrobiae bacterium]|jgi:hypothetical protein